jgi:hypothetical protein
VVQLPKGHQAMTSASAFEKGPSTAARSRQVYMEWLEVIVLSVYLSEEKRTSIYVCSSFLATWAPAQLNPSTISV